MFDQMGLNVQTFTLLTEKCFFAMVIQIRGLSDQTVVLLFFLPLKTHHLEFVLTTDD